MFYMTHQFTILKQQNFKTSGLQGLVPQSSEPREPPDSLFLDSVRRQELDNYQIQ